MVYQTHMCECGFSAPCGCIALTFHRSVGSSQAFRCAFGYHCSPSIRVCMDRRAGCLGSSESYKSCRYITPPTSIRRTPRRFSCVCVVMYNHIPHTCHLHAWINHQVSYLFSNFHGYVWSSIERDMDTSRRPLDCRMRSQSRTDGVIFVL